MCEVLPFGATIQKAVLGQAMVSPASFPSPHRWLWVLRDVARARQMVRTSVRGHGGVQYQDVWHFRLPGTCGAQYTRLNLGSCCQ